MLLILLLLRLQRIITIQTKVNEVYTIKKKTLFVKELFANNLLNLKTMTSILRIKKIPSKCSTINKYQLKALTKNE